ncbi:MAG: molybdopterin synthase catalytic subunit MoaE [Burkholderiaceae bacterium]|nr:molybdopterin synthase catalytic subunit MoaE [Burkholderiaceae bacterium]
MTPITIRIQTEPFDLGAETQALRAGRLEIGAIASFVGLCRDHHPGISGPGHVQAMELEHYPGMTERAIAEMVRAAQSRWPLLGITVIHRVGRLLPGDDIVLVLVASSHRVAAFAACEFLMDYLKTQAPFWKKETTPQGGQWVDARESDDAALRRWGVDSGNAV